MRIWRAACGSIRYLSTATVVFAFPRDAVRHDLEGHRLRGAARRGHQHHGRRVDFVEVAAARARRTRAACARFSEARAIPTCCRKSDTELTNAALGDLTKILGIRGVPTLTRVYRWNRSSPQQEVGHGDLMKRIDARLARHPGLFISAAGFRGVGIPDCIADARSTAGAAAVIRAERQVAKVS